MLVLGIETSCDETAGALVEIGADGKATVRDQLIASQVKEHRPFGGIVPEIATRQHLLHLERLTRELLARQNIGLSQLSGIGVTRGPGLASSLLVGLSFAKGLAMAAQLPWIGVNHLEGHIFSAFLGQNRMPDESHIALIVSGGHTLLVHVETAPYRYRVLGSTRDDAAGEAFDKAAKMLGLGYPGGPEIEALAAQGGNPHAIHFPRAMLDVPASDKHFLDFSFSGLKTALKIYLYEHPEIFKENQLRKNRLLEELADGGAISRQERSASPEKKNRGDFLMEIGGAERGCGSIRSTPTVVGESARQMRLCKQSNICASFQEAIVDVLVQKSKRACIQTGAKLFTLSGGVGCNQRLREACEAMAREMNLQFLVAPKVLTTDNAAMIALVAAARLSAGETSPWDEDIDPNLKLSSPQALKF